MIKSKRKWKKSKTILKNPNAIVILVLASLSLLSMTVFVLYFVNQNRIATVQKREIEQSRMEFDNILSRFNEKLTHPHDYQERSTNSCSSGVKYSFKYRCGNQFLTNVSQIDEEQFRLIEQQLIDDFINSHRFDVITRTQPSYSEYAKAFTGGADLEFENSDMECYMSSSFKVESGIAEFYGGCHLTSEKKFF